MPCEVVSRVELARDITRVDKAAANDCELVDSAENNVGWSVLTVPFPPAFNDSPIVSICFEVCSWSFGYDEGSDE